MFKGGKRSGGGGQGKGGGFVGKRRGQGDRWDIPACSNTVGKKALLEFKVKNFPPNTWSGGQIGTNGK